MSDKKKDEHLTYGEGQREQYGEGQDYRPEDKTECCRQEGQGRFCGRYTT